MKDKKRGRSITPEQAARIFPSRESKLRNLRLSRGLTQKNLADLAGVGIRVIQTYEQGDRSPERAELATICAICIALECRLPDILEDEKLIEMYEKCK